jgi:hypothetical protein
MAHTNIRIQGSEAVLFIVTLFNNGTSTGEVIDLQWIWATEINSNGGV